MGFVVNGFRFSAMVLILAGWGFLSTLTLFKYRNFAPVQALSKIIQVHTKSRDVLTVFQRYNLIAAKAMGCI